jgi:signal transduction histidine kinase/DNA-binding response OmpR family regulator
MFKPSSIKVLVVDDTPDNLRLLATILESHHYIVRKSLNGRTALQAAHRDPPNLILLDINMPEMNGYEVCQQLRASDVTAHIPIIFISALDQTPDKVRAFEMGGQDYITKPFQALEVLARVKNQLLIQQHRQQLVEKNQQLEQEIQDRQAAEAEVRRLNVSLERQVQVRTLELQQALAFESTLKRISDKVRDSLDQHQILQNAVEELAIALQVHCCDAVLYSPDHQSSTIRYQYIASGLTATQGQLLYMADAPEIYDQLQTQRSCFAFCQLQPLAIRNHSAILACPIFDDQVDETGILGDLWLFKKTASSFSDIEIHLVQQVANQCAIALRQARLYEAAQAQVIELQHLNELKDDFLSTISHELRTPIASMKMVLKLLTSITDQGRSLIEELSKSSAQSSKVTQYFKVLQEECDRELALVEDLLSLQHVEAGTYVSQPMSINLQDLIAHLIEPFEARTQNQQQILKINLDPNLPTLTVDPQVITRIITELVSNACKYTPAGETISISASISDHITTGPSAHLLQFTIANTGVEIPPDELSRIFDKFYRVPNNDPWKHGGTGLGLALVKKLVEQMSGTIQVESANQQTCFTVQLAV